MPELPEVEIVKLGLAPHIINARIDNLVLRRANLRFEFPINFSKKVVGTTIKNISRRAKYLLFELSSGQTILAHLGMTGNFRFFEPPKPNQFEKHDHVVFELSNSNAPTQFLVYSDPRRFGFMDLLDDVDDCAFLKHLGPEPLGNHMTTDLLVQKFAKRKGPIKTVLLDQKTIAGLGNIYVCEALFRSQIHPATPASALAEGENGAPDKRLPVLTRAIRHVLEEALQAGGSTLQDYRNVEGQSGYFQHRFAVYDKEGESCPREQCDGHIMRLVQSGRSSFYCPGCQSQTPPVDY